MFGQADDDDVEMGITRKLERSAAATPPPELADRKRKREEKKKDVKLALLKQQLADKDAGGEGKTMTTQTHKEEETQDVLTAHEKSTPEQEIKKQERKEAAKGQAREEYQKDEEG